MIIAIANQDRGDSGKSIVASNLALLRARAGRKVMLVDADPKQACSGWSSEREAAGLKPPVAARAVAGRDLPQQIEALGLRYNDILIDTESGDTPAGRSALIAARLVVVPVTVGQADLAGHYQLIARLNSARMFNPGLRVLFVIVGAPSDPSGAELAAVRDYVAHVMSATLASTIIHVQGAERQLNGGGSGICDAASSDLRAAAEMRELYREVFVTK